MNPTGDGFETGLSGDGLETCVAGSFSYRENGFRNRSFWGRSRNLRGRLVLIPRERVSKPVLLVTSKPVGDTSSGTTKEIRPCRCSSIAAPRADIFLKRLSLVTDNQRRARDAGRRLSRNRFPPSESAAPTVATAPLRGSDPRARQAVVEGSDRGPCARPICKTPRVAGSRRPIGIRV